MQVVPPQSQSLRVADILAQVPAIANFASSDSVLHLPGDGTITVNSEQYELRMFAFKTLRPSASSFAEFIAAHNLGDQEFASSRTTPLVKVLSFTMTTDDTYIILSLRQLSQ